MLIKQISSGIQLQKVIRWVIISGKNFVLPRSQQEDLSPRVMQEDTSQDDGTTTGVHDPLEHPLAKSTSLPSGEPSSSTNKAPVLTA